MAALVGAVVFVVVVVGGMGSLPGAFLASLLIGCLQTFSVALDWSVAGGLAALGVQLAPGRFLTELASITISQAAPVLPYLLMVLMLIFRPRGLMGTRDS
jgi:branched-chain amino acid transport system permease protein